MLQPFTYWTIPPKLYERLEQLLRPGMATLETGSGLSTRLFDAAGCHHIALEHDRRFAADSPSVVVAPLIGNPPWYDWDPPHPFDLLLIDGPPQDAGGRMGLLRICDRLVHRTTIIVLDDTHRAPECALAERLAQRFCLRAQNFDNHQRRFTILTP